jgi:hypothetical protein
MAETCLPPRHKVHDYIYAFSAQVMYLSRVLRIQKCGSTYSYYVHCEQLPP